MMKKWVPKKELAARQIEESKWHQKPREHYLREEHPRPRRIIKGQLMVMSRHETEVCSNRVGSFPIG